MVTLPDDHDIGHPNLWGAGGKRALRTDGADGGYFFPAAYVNMVQRQQTWHLPDPVDPTPVEQGISVSCTRFVLGGVDFAIIEDRKFKTGPAGKIPQLGPRPDRIDDPSYDRKAIDLPDLELLGDRQISWLRGWAEEWQGIRAKWALSQTAFCGAVHLHGTPGNRLLADLDCNGWPQSKRNDALRILKQARELREGLTSRGRGHPCPPQTQTVNDWLLVAAGLTESPHRRPVPRSFPYALPFQ